MKEENSNKRKYRKYDSAFKANVVSQIRQGRSIKDLSSHLGVSESLLYKWKSDSEGRSSDQSVELKQLRKELKSLREENDILKKALSIFTQSS